MNSLLKVVLLFVIVAGSVMIKNEIIAQKVEEKVEKMDSVKSGSVTCLGLIDPTCEISNFKVIEDNREVLSALSLKVSSVIALNDYINNADVAQNFSISLNHLELGQATKNQLSEAFDGRDIEPINILIDYYAETNSSTALLDIKSLKVNTSLFDLSLGSKVKIAEPKTENPKFFVDHLTLSLKDVRENGKSLLIRDSDLKEIQNISVSSKAEQHYKDEVLKFAEGKKELIELSLVNKSSEIEVKDLLGQLYMMSMFGQLNKIDEILDIKVEAK